MHLRINDLIMSLVKLIVEDKPLIFLGLPGILSLLIGTFFGVWLLQIYAFRHHIETNVGFSIVIFYHNRLFCFIDSYNLVWNK